MEVVCFLGFKIAHGELQTDEEKRLAIKEWTKTCSVMDIRSFHGLASDFYVFIDGFVCLSSSPMTLNNSGKKWFWGDR